MHLSISVFMCLAAAARGGFLRDLVSPKGWHLGDGVVLHLTDSRHPNSTFLERHSIMMDYGGYGVSVGKVSRRKALEVDLYAPGDEARGRKHSSFFTLIIGYKMATVAAIALSAVGALVLKSLIVAKISAIMSTILLVGKFFHGKEPEAPKHVEIEAPIELQADYLEFPTDAEYHPTGSSGYYTYADYVPGIDYSPESSNATVHDVPGNQQVARRRAGSRRKVPLLTIHHFIKS